MKIGIDYRFAAKTVRGIGTYVREIVKQLMVIDTVNEYILYTDSDSVISLPKNFKIKQLNPHHIILFEQFYLPKMAARDRLDLLWYPANSGPLFLKKTIKLAVTVHDLIALMDLNAVRTFSLAAIRYRLGEYYRNFALRFGLNRIDLLLTVSQYSAKQIGHYLKRDAQVVTNHINRFDQTGDESALTKYGLQKKAYFYSMTGESPHKNLDGLLKVFSHDPLPYKLVVSGVYNVNLIKSLSEEYGDQVIFTGYVTETEKVSLYQYAAAFLFLPKYEGFGIPLLEAMQFNIPIIASNRASIPEVIGHAGQLVDPDDIGSIRDLIKQLPSLGGIDDINPAHDEQIRKFSSWRSSAEKIQTLFTQNVS